jgi:predicted anti-sigma-YlaC factor YlaD
MAPDRPEEAAQTITCRALTRWASAYLDGRVLEVVARNTMDAHLASCAGCRAYVNQIALVSQTLQVLPGPIMESAQRDRLRRAFAVRRLD